MSKDIAARVGTRPGAGASFGHVLATVLLGVWQLVIAIKNRRQLADLIECDDHQLSDMGITRDDVLAALSQPLWRDPSTALARCARKASKTPTLLKLIKTNDRDAGRRMGPRGGQGSDRRYCGKQG